MEYRPEFDLMDLEDTHIPWKKISQQGLDVYNMFWTFRKLFLSPRYFVP